MALKLDVLVWLCDENKSLDIKLSYENCEYFLIHKFKQCFVCSKEQSQLDGSFEYPQPMFWFINKKINF